MNRMTPSSAPCPQGESPGQNSEREDEENSHLDNLRGGADPSGGQSSEVPRDNGRTRLGLFGTEGEAGERGHEPADRQNDESRTARPSEEDLASSERELEDGDE